eukprot:2482655-Rhodomonas_salina.2
MGLPNAAHLIATAPPPARLLTPGRVLAVHLTSTAHDDDDEEDDDDDDDDDDVTSPFREAHDRFPPLLIVTQNERPTVQSESWRGTNPR